MLIKILSLPKRLRQLLTCASTNSKPQCSTWICSLFQSTTFANLTRQSICYYPQAYRWKANGKLYPHPWELKMYRCKRALLKDAAHNARAITKLGWKRGCDNKCSCGRKRWSSTQQNTFPPRTFATAVNVFLIFSRPTKPLILLQLNSKLISKNFFH